MTTEPGATERIPAECQWQQKGASHYLDAAICHRLWTIVCSKRPREKYVCSRHAGSHKRERPRAYACTDADHFLLVREP